VVSSLDSEHFSTLEFELDRVIGITIDHSDSELNAVDDRMHRELTRLFGLLRQEDQARAAILIERGRASSAGGDFNGFPTLDSISLLPVLLGSARAKEYLLRGDALAATEAERVGLVNQ
jgi:enoyl-CoA hydratase/carnithine racemase